MPPPAPLLPPIRRVKTKGKHQASTIPGETPKGDAEGPEALGDHTPEKGKGHLLTIFSATDARRFCSRTLELQVSNGTDMASCCHLFTTFSAARRRRFCSSTCSCQVLHGMAQARSVHLQHRAPTRHARDARDGFWYTFLYTPLSTHKQEQDISSRENCLPPDQSSLP